MYILKTFVLIHFRSFLLKNTDIEYSHVAPTSLAKQFASELDQLTLISCKNFQQKITSKSIMKVYTSLAQSGSNFLLFLKFKHYVTTFSTYIYTYFEQILSLCKTWMNRFSKYISQFAFNRST